MTIAIVLLAIALVVACASSVYLSRQLRDSIAGERAATEAQFEAERMRLGAERDRDLERAARIKSDAERLAMADQLVATQRALNAGTEKLVQYKQRETFGATAEQALVLLNQELGVKL